MYYESLMVMTKQKTCNRKTNDKEKLVKAYSTKKNQFLKKDSVKGRKNYKTIRKQWIQLKYCHYLSIITLNISGLNSLIKRNKVA